MNNSLIYALIFVFTENLVITKCFGTSTTISISKNKTNIFGISGALTYFATISSMLNYLADTYILINVEYIKPLVYVAIIAIVYIITLVILSVFLNKIFIKVKKYIHISAFNGAVLGCMLLNNEYNDSFWSYTLFGLYAGVSFLIASFMLKIAYNKLNSDNVDTCFKGFPITLIYIGIISMAMFAIKNL